jgi:hypothetical protein
LSRPAVAAKLIHMSRLDIGDQLTEETAEGEGALPSEHRRFLSAISHRMVWVAQDGDVLVLPSHPGVGFLAYVRRVNGSAEGEPLILVPPPGRQGAESLYDDRLAAPELVAGLRTFGGVAFPAERGGELVGNEAVRAVGDDCGYLTARALISRNRVPWPSFAEAEAEAVLDKHGPAFGLDAEAAARPASESRV